MGSVLSELPNCRVLSRLSLGMIDATQLGIASYTAILEKYAAEMRNNCRYDDALSGPSLVIHLKSCFFPQPGWPACTGAWKFSLIPGTGTKSCKAPALQACSAIPAGPQLAASRGSAAGGEATADTIWRQATSTALLASAD